MQLVEPPKIRKTQADYEALEEGAPYQLIGGELIMSPAPSFWHQQITWKLGTLLFQYVETHHLGIVVGAPVDVYLSEIDIVQPDLLFISHSRAELIDTKGILGAPDLVVEVLSPSTGYYDLTHKRKAYETAGVKEYWLVNPEFRSIKRLVLEANGYASVQDVEQTGTVTSDVIEGFSVELAEVFGKR